MILPFVYIVLFTIACHVSSGEYVQMKIVDEISNYGWNAPAHDLATKLNPKADPASFSGPSQFENLATKCFTYVEEDYKYEFCPFKNITQHERTLRWNPYSGILGIWKGWEIKNNTFTAMLLSDGDDCESTSRSVRVVMHCGSKNNVTSVVEPMKCNYLLNFETPLVCHRDSMLVYPVLNPILRQKWNDLEQDFYEGIYTEKGYDNKLNSLLFEAGLVPKKEDKPAKDNLKPFTSLADCNKEYFDLLKEFEKLKKQLEEK